MEFLLLELFATPIWIWLSFLAIVVALLAFDLGVLNKKDEAMGFRRSLYLSIFYVVISIAFGGWIWFEFGGERALPFFAAYVVEKSLSLDNIFVMSVIFAYYGIPLQYQHRVLFWGIIGVLVLRGICIAAGTALVSQFSWILFIFGGLLIYTGIKIMFSDEDEAPDLERSRFRKMLTMNFNVSNQLHGNRFLIWQKSEVTGLPKLHVTPLFMALITIEFADLLFAMDSIPAVLAITQDTFIVFTSNIFAILGLRAMYFMLAALLERFKYLKYALSLVLIFIGGKIFFNHFVFKIPPEISLSLTLFILVGGGVLSFVASKYFEKEKPS